MDNAKTCSLLAVTGILGFCAGALTTRRIMKNAIASTESKIKVTKELLNWIAPALNELDEEAFLAAFEEKVTFWFIAVNEC